MKTKNLIGYRFTVLLLTLALVTGVFAARSTLAQVQEGYLVLERSIETSKLGIKNIDGIAYAESSGMFWLVEGQNAVMMDSFERSAGAAKLSGKIDAANLAFDNSSNGLFGLDANGGMLALQGQSAASFNLNSLSLANARGISVDSASGRLFVLDASGKQVFVSKGSAPAEKISLNVPQQVELRGIAFNPQTSRLFALSQTDLKVYEFDLTGKSISVHDLSSLGVKTASAILFAPSGDQTDSEAEMSLYVAAGSELVELSLSGPVINEVTADLPISLVNSFQTSTWNPPSTDPTGIVYVPQMNRFMVVDSDVDQTPLWENKNVFITTDTGNLNTTCTTEPYSTEPTGVAYLPSANTMYITDDDKDRIHVLDLGADGIPCTGDDSGTEFIDMVQYGSNDATGITIVDGLLYVSDGLNFEVYVINPSSGNLVRQFDISGVDTDRQAQGIEYYPSRDTLILVTRSTGFLFEMDGNGNLLNRFNVRFAAMNGNSGVGLGPRSNDPTKLSLYVTARGDDFVQTVDFNDGWVYEYAIDETSVPPAPVFDNFIFLPLMTR